MSNYLLNHQCYHNKALGEICTIQYSWAFRPMSNTYQMSSYPDQPNPTHFYLCWIFFQDSGSSGNVYIPWKLLAFLKPFMVMAIYSLKLFVHCEFGMYVSPFSSLPILCYSSLQTLSFEFQTIRLYSFLLPSSTRSLLIPFISWDFSPPTLSADSQFIVKESN